MRIFPLPTTTVLLIGLAFHASAQPTDKTNDAAVATEFFAIEKTVGVEFKEIKLDDTAGVTAKFLAEVCPKDDKNESAICLATREAIKANQSTRLQQMLATRTRLDQVNFQTQIVIAEWQRDQAALKAAEAANAVAAELATMVDADALADLTGDVTELKNQLGELAIARDITELSGRLDELVAGLEAAGEGVILPDPETWRAVVDFLSGMQDTCNTNPDVSWCGGIADLPDMKTLAIELTPSDITFREPADNG